MILSVVNMLLSLFETHRVSDLIILLWEFESFLSVLNSIVKEFPSQITKGAKGESSSLSLKSAILASLEHADPKDPAVTSILAEIFNWVLKILVKHTLFDVQFYE